MRNNYISKLKQILLKLSKTDIKISKHAVKRLVERNISVNCVHKFLLNPIKLIKVDKQNGKYRLQFDLSSKYDLIIVVAFLNSSKKGLKVITVIKTNKKWQKALQK